MAEHPQDLYSKEQRQLRQRAAQNVNIAAYNDKAGTASAPSAASLEAALTDITLSALTVADAEDAGVVVGTLASVPVGASFSITGTAGGRFALSGNNVVTTSTPVDIADTDYEITIVATRSDETRTESFTITVTA